MDGKKLSDDAKDIYKQSCHGLLGKFDSISMNEQVDGLPLRDLQDQPKPKIKIVHIEYSRLDCNYLFARFAFRDPILDDVTVPDRGSILNTCRLFLKFGIR